MRVKMRETRQAAADGIHVVTLLEGEVYDLSGPLVEGYLARGIAVAAEPAASPVQAAPAVKAGQARKRSRSPRSSR